MAYKPKNVASYRDNSGRHPVGDGGINKAQVPGTTGSDDRESQPVGAELNGQFTSEASDGNRNQQHGPDFTLMGNENSPRTNPNMGKRSYAAGTPTLGD